MAMIRMLPAWECGWLRVPDKDKPGLEAWEAPDGEIAHMRPENHPYIFRRPNGEWMLVARPVECPEWPFSS